jgi:outer membrane immunogenic protein
MRTISFGSIALVVLTAGGAAMAADMPARPAYKAPPPAAIAYNWTGFYVGLNAGYSWGRTDIDYVIAPGAASADFATPPCSFGTCPFGFRLSPDSFIGGGQIGFNYQTGALVWGAETDIAWRNRSSTLTHVFAGNVNGDYTVLTASQNWVGTLRAKLGVAANTWLIYATGGLAYGRFEHSVGEFSFGGIFPVNRTLSQSHTRAGWTVGGGAEYAFDPQWSLGVHYLYMDFGSETLAFGRQIIGSTDYAASTASFHDRSHVVRAQLNYRFGVAPVVARY